MREFIIDPWRSSPEFGDGFVKGFGCAGIVGFCFSLILFWRGQVRRYFSPTQIPATQPGPSPFRIYSSCLAAIFKLLLLGTFLLLVIGAFFTALGD
jgi:hypothetical protein